MGYETIGYEVSDRVATITLNRPEALNALSPAMIGELRQAYADAEADDEVWLLLVTGTGRAFCTGADVGEIPDDGRVDLRGAVPLDVPAVGGAAGGHAAVPHDDEADPGRRQRDLLRCRAWTG